MGRGRAPCCAKVGLNRGTWTPEEDMRLVTYVHKYGHGNWRALPKLAGLLRCGKSCRLRWINYLRPDVKRGNFTKEEEDTIVRLHGLLGNKWSKIASRLPGRTDNEIKNVWNTHLKKRFAQRRSAQQKAEERPCSDEGDCKAEKKQIETDKIETPIEPNLDLWCSLQDIDPSVLDLLDSTSTSTTTTTATSGDHYQNSTSTDLEAGLSGGDESEGWLQYLEEELELWGESSPTVTPADMEGGDAVASYFHALQSSPSPLYL